MSLPVSTRDCANFTISFARILSIPIQTSNLIFLDNHDMTRFFLSVGRDVRKLKMDWLFFLQREGSHELYYGTELLMDGDGGYHPNVRKDFPGGWPGDNANGFTAAGGRKIKRKFMNTSKNF
jgi:glycosidase